MRATVLSFLLIASLVVAGKAGFKRKCGAGLPACARNRCCMPDGYCAKDTGYCREGCQEVFGRCKNPHTNPHTNHTIPTPGNTTTTTPRPVRPQNGPPAQIFYQCTVPGTVAITFDDGPAATTPKLLDVLQGYPDVHVTFFINGLNYVNASLPEYQAVISRAYQNGHQIASHTYQHKDLAKLSDPEIVDQMLKNDDVIYSATGRVPRYVRPPYGSTNAAALATLGRLGYVVVNWNVDTLDWKTGDAQASAQVYDTQLSNGQSQQFIALEHDTVQSTAEQLMGLVIPKIRSAGLRMVTVAECLGDSQPYL